jgi:prepilin-type N-terminal cleavage/methylation domain-containing protein
MRNSGFSLIEVVVVIGLIAILSTTGLVINTQILSRRSSLDQRQILVRALQQARSLALFSGKSHGLYFNESEYTVFEGDFFNQNNPKNYSIPRSSSIVIHSPLQVVFKAVTGSLSVNEAKILLIMNDSEELEIIVRQTGAIL